ncbi:MAG: hypothetical protein JWN48_2094 [Myxococcaceae bacterium]|nr:hypothetical protein [Myxococcaceae bacterium]
MRDDLQDERAGGPRAAPHWAVQLVRALDDGITVPGTAYRIGLDGIVGMVIPVLGDATTAVGALSLLFLALQRGVPRVVLLRMAFNVALDALLGSVPIVGDLFDFAWKANRKNLQLIERATLQPNRPTTFGDYVVVCLFVLFVIAAVALPFLLTGLIIARLLK